MSVLIETQFGEIVCDEQEEWGYNEATRIRFQLGPFIVDLDTPRHIQTDHADEDDQFPATLSINIRPRDMTSEEAVELGALLAFSSETARLFNEWNQPLIEAAEKREAEKEQAAQEEQAKKDEVTQERKDQLLNELMGETVRVRHATYRTTAKAVVEHRERRYEGETEETKWEPRLRWCSANNANRRHDDVENWKLLDVKTERGWRNVWDDGNDDIGGPARAPGRANIAPWDGGLC